MEIGELLRERCIAIGLPPGTKNEILKQLIALAAEVHNVGHQEAVLETLYAREAVGSTGIGNGVALPHGRCAGVSGLIVAAATVPEGTDYNALDGKPVRLFFLILSPKNAPGEHLKLMAKITRLLSTESVREGLIHASTPAEFWSILYEADRQNGT